MPPEFRGAPLQIFVPPNQVFEIDSH